MDIEEGIQYCVTKPLNVKTDIPIGIGLDMIDVVQLITKILEGMMIITYVPCASSLIVSLYIPISSFFITNYE